MSREATTVLADFAAKSRYEDIPDRAREHSKTLLLDALACAVAGQKGEETDQVRALATALGQTGESSIAGSACRRI